jgi:type IV pilus assembly protein PilC
MPVNFSSEQLKNINSDPEGKEKNKISFIKKIDAFLLTLSKIPLKERLFFVQHLRVMLKAGISLSIAIKTLAKQTQNKYFKKILENIGSQVEEGKSFAESLEAHKKIFGELFINMIEAGELSGKLEDVLGNLFLQMKKEHALYSKIKGALTYPVVILIAMFGIGAFMFVFIIPKITGMFDEMGAELPLPTKILIGISNTIINNGIISAIVFVVSIVSFLKIIQTKKGKYVFQSFLLKAPIISSIIKKINIAKFSRNVSSLLKTDIMIIKTFQITANVMGNLHYRESLIEMSQQIKKGGKLSEVIENYPKLFNPVVSQMVAVGEETGELDSILEELAEFYEEEVNQIMESLPTIIEPLLILIMGIGVGAIAVAVIMPMYSLTSVI